MVITVVAPITNDNNKVIGVVMGGLDYKELISIDDIKLGNTGYAYILGKDGTTIAHPNDELVLNQDNTIKASSDDPNLVPLAKLEEKMVKRETGIGTYEYDEVEKFMAYAPIEGTEWSMALTQEKDEVFSGINLMKKYIFIITVIFIILGIIFGIGISRMITLPLLKMNQYTGELAQGNLSKKLNFNRNDELGETASALNIAVEAIKELIQKAKQLALLSRESSESITASTEEEIYIPITVAERLLQTRGVRVMYIQASSQDTVTLATNEISSKLSRIFKDNPDSDFQSFRVFDQTQMLDTINQATGTLTMMLGGIAAISLLVGGIGIMNIMLVSVTERTREIGIRKALGARKRDVMSQFLIESLVISGIGGVIGIVTGFLLSRGIAQLMNMGVKTTYSVVAVAFGFSMLVGVFFGIYPANKASNLKPIEALRYE
jgi:ABC-type antimicrobial peptide transport system permease subunit